jgi:NADPH-dependent 2,4-dienoyl-CoA reductase/sulfur reductase-like enzyme
MKTSKYVILGGGMVAGYAAKKLVESGLNTGELTILSADSALPYERPPLSKGFLAGKDAEESIFINSKDLYEKHGIEVRLQCEVTALDPIQKNLHLRSGEDLGFEKLVLATGARVRKLDIPGTHLPGMYYLRSLEDSKQIGRQAANAKRAVVIGGGFISMEVTAVLAQKGIETTMVVQDDRVWKRFFTPAMSQFFEDYYTARGVRFAKQTIVKELQGNAVVKIATLSNGTNVACDMVVAGVGVEPITDPVGHSGIAVNDGVVVNEFLETTRPDVYAAGDVAKYYDVLFEKRRRVEHWDNAVSQGEHCADLLVGRRVPFNHVPYFFSDVFDLSYEFWGDSADSDEIIERGDLSSTNFSVWWLRKGYVVAVFAMNRPDEEREAAPRWIQSKQRVPAVKLKGEAKLPILP